MYLQATVDTFVQGVFRSSSKRYKYWWFRTAHKSHCQERKNETVKRKSGVHKLQSRLSHLVTTRAITAPPVLSYINYYILTNSKSELLSVAVVQASRIHFHKRTDGCRGTRGGRARSAGDRSDSYSLKRNDFGGVPVHNLRTVCFLISIPSSN
jgi:hypothetical protein